MKKNVNFSHIGLLLFIANILAPCLFAQNPYPASVLNDLIFKQEFRAQRASSANKNLQKNGDNVSIKPGETYVLAELDGPGIINHIWMTISAKDPFYGRSLVLRIFWDGSDKPAVESPVGDFFAGGHGANIEINSAPVSVSSNGRARNCYWKMPFRKKAKITITNESKKYGNVGLYYYIDWEKHHSLPPNILYFHAQYKQEFPAKSGDYTILNISGSGQYVGVVYSAQSMELGWFGEGDDRIYIDGETYPSLSGTGTEDYFGDAWGFRQFNRPYYGVSLWEGYYPGDRTTAYRWHIQDPIPFNNSIKVTIEHKGSIYLENGVSLSSFIERYDWLSSVAFWYQSSPEGNGKIIPQADKRIAPYLVIDPKELNIRTKPQNGLQKADVGVTFMPMKSDAVIEFDFNIEKKGRYQVSAFLQHTLFSGRYQAFLDDKPLGPIMDLYTSGNDPFWHNFDLYDLKPGTHILKFAGRGASPSMRSLTPHVYLFAIDYLVLLRLEDMKGYHEILRKLTQNK